MNDIGLTYPNLTIKLGNRLSEAQRLSATGAGLPDQEGHLTSLPEQAAHPDAFEDVRTYAELRDLHRHPPLHLGRTPSNSIRDADKKSFVTFALANVKELPHLDESIARATQTASRKKALCDHRQRVQSGVLNAGPPLTPEEEAEADAPLPKVESGYVSIKIGGASWLKEMLQRWELVSLGEADFNRRIDVTAKACLIAQQEAVDNFRRGLCCEQAVELIANSQTLLFNNCQKCLPPSLQSDIILPGDIVGSQHNADRYWLDRYGLDERRTLRNVPVGMADNAKLSVEDEEEDDEMFDTSESSASEFVDSDRSTDDDSLRSCPLDVVEEAAVTPQQGSVIALMDLKALQNTATEQVELLLQWIYELEMRGNIQRIQVVYDGTRYLPEWEYDCAGLHITLSHKVVQVITYQLRSWAKDAALSDHSHTLCFQRDDRALLTFRLSPYLAANNPLMPLLKLYLTFGIGARNDPEDAYLPCVEPAMRYEPPDVE